MGLFDKKYCELGDGLVYIICHMFWKSDRKFGTIDYSHIYPLAEQMVFQASESLDVKQDQ